MWDSLGVLAIKIGSGVVRARDRARSSVHRTPIPHAAGYAFGGPIVPVGGTVAIRSPRRSGHVRTRLAGLVQRLRSRPGSEVVPLRVPIDVVRPPLATAILRLAAGLAVGSLAISAIVYAVGAIAVRAFLHLIG